MNYSQNQLFEVAKKLLIFSGKKQILSATEKKKIMPQLSLILEDIQKDKTQLSLKVSEFIKDILSDIENDRVIDIDSIQADNHLENFIQAESYTVSYNSILKQGGYNSLVLSIKDNKPADSYLIAIRLKTQLKKIVKILDTQRFSELLLIINIYQISNLLKYYKILYKYSFTSNDTKTAQVILEIISLIHGLHADIHKKSIKNIETKDIESSYMMCDIKNNKLSFSAIKVVSDNNKEHMYKKILIKNFNI